MRKRIEPRALLAAVLVGVVAIAGTATAAGVLITSSKQIKKGVVKRSDLSKRVRAQLDAAGRPGPQGEKGDPGTPGDPGPSDAYTVSRTNGIDLSGITPVLTLDVPKAGSYVVNADLFLISEGTENETTRCTLEALDAEGGPLKEVEFVEHTIAQDPHSPDANPFGEAVFPLQGAYAFSAPGQFQVECQEFAGQEVRVRTAHLTAIRVGALHEQPDM